MDKIIVAEIGTNWNPSDWQASWSVAMQEAKDAGATHCKAQDWFPLSAMNRSDEWKAHCEPWTLTPEMKRWIDKEAKRIGVQFFTSVFTLEALYWAANHGYPLIKIASSEAANDRLIRCVSGRVPTVVSFGERTSLRRITMTLTMLNTRGPVIACACVAEYPTPTNTAWEALEQIYYYQDYGLQAGWSSHVAGSDAAVLANLAALRGATYFEFHFKSSATPENAPDAGPWSLTQDEFAVVVQAITR